LLGDARVEDTGHVGVAHDRKCLALGLEAGEDLAAVHAGLDHLERHAAADRLDLLRQIDDPHAAFAEGLQDAVVTDPLRARVRCVRGFGRGRAGRIQLDAGVPLQREPQKALGAESLGGARRERGTAPGTETVGVSHGNPPGEEALPILF
jgi:hypothetical protein